MKRGAIIRDQRGSSAAEFALVAPLAVLIIFCIIDGGRYLWEINRAEKATQAGARVAAVTGMIPAGLITHSYSISNGLAQGAVVGAGDFPGVTCTGTAGGVTCSWISSPTVNFDLAPDADHFNHILARMQQFLPTLEAADVTVTYENTGLGFAGDPAGSDVAPMITVALSDNAEFEPILTSVFNVNWGMPSAAYSLTQEDGQGLCFEEQGGSGASCALE